MSAAKTLEHLLHSGELDKLLAHGARVAKANEALCNRLEASLREHCRVANLKGDTVIVIADSPVWATKLRFQTGAMLEILRDRGFPELRTLRIKVNPINVTREAAPRHGPQLSQSAAATLLRTAEGTKDVELRAVLERLAARSGKAGKGPTGSN